MKMVRLLVLGAVLLGLGSSVMAERTSATRGTVRRTSEVIAKERPIGVGAILGAPTGFTAQFWRSATQSVAAGVSFFGLGYGAGSWVMGYGDYLFHFLDAFKNAEFSPYVGPGAFVSTWGGYYGYNTGGLVAGIRGVGGVQWYPRDLPMGFFAEFGPAVGILPGFYTSFFGGVGGRYFF